MNTRSQPAPTLQTDDTRIRSKPPFSDLIDAWNDQRGPNQAPEPEAFDLLSIMPYLDQTSVLELSDDGDVRYQFTGTDIANVYQIEPTGNSLRDLMPAATGEMMKRLVTECVHRPIGFYLTYRSTYISGKCSENEIFYLPLVSQTGNPHRAVAVQIFGETVHYDDPRDSARIAHELHQGSWVDIGFGGSQLPIELEL